MESQEVGLQPEPRQVFLLSSLVIALFTTSPTFVIIPTLSLQNLSPKGTMKDKVSTEGFRFDESFFYDENTFFHKIPGKLEWRYYCLAYLSDSPPN